MDVYSLTLPKYHLLLDGTLTRKLKHHLSDDSEGVILADAGHHKCLFYRFKSGDFIISPPSVEFKSSPEVLLQELPKKGFPKFHKDPVPLARIYALSLKDSIDEDEARRLAWSAWIRSDKIKLTVSQAAPVRQILNEVGFNLVYVKYGYYKIKFFRRKKSKIVETYYTENAVNCYYMFVRSPSRVLSQQGVLLKLR